MMGLPLLKRSYSHPRRWDCVGSQSGVGTLPSPGGNRHGPGCRGGDDGPGGYTGLAEDIHESGGDPSAKREGRFVIGVVAPGVRGGGEGGEGPPGSKGRYHHQGTGRWPGAAVNQPITPLPTHGYSTPLRGCHPTSPRKQLEATYLI